MASPHVAGLMAYLISLYPSETFDPVLDDGFLPRALESQGSFTASYFSIYRLAHASLPAFISEFLPSPSTLQALNPTFGDLPMLTPEQLKKAVIELSTEGILSELPAKTPNLLVFNNATYVN
jgi:cerevisin